MILFTLTVTVLFWRQRQFIAFHPQGDGFYIPDLSIVDNDNQVISTSSLEHPLAILFVEECVSCGTDEPLSEWNKLYEQFPSANFLVVPAFNGETSNNSPSKNIRFVIGGGEGLAKACAPTFFPQIFLFDRSGYLRYKQKSRSLRVAISELRNVISTIDARGQL